jgi:hypothetical protein
MQRLWQLFDRSKRENDASADDDRYPIFVTARMWEYIEPIARGKRYEDPLDAFLTRSGIGELDGGGTQMGESPGIEFVDVTFYLSDSDQASHLAARELGRLGAPVGSELRFVRNERQVSRSFGTTECVGIFLDGTTLPTEVYKNRDVNATLKHLKAALAEPGLGEFRSHWRGHLETALFFYGPNADAMQAKMMPVLLSDPLCQNARVVSRFGRHPHGSSEERLPRQG